VRIDEELVEIWPNEVCDKYNRSISKTLVTATILR